MIAQATFLPTPPPAALLAAWTPPDRAVDQIVRLTPSPIRPRRNLPLPPTPLIGRGQETAAALALLRQPETRVLSLTGPAGVGKTRLALEIATHLTDEDGIETAFVSLASIQDSALTLTTVARALGLPDDDRNVLPSLASRLRDRPLLLVLDTLDHLPDAAADLAKLEAASPRVRLLTTTRAPLRIRAERDFPLAPLPLPLATERDLDTLTANPAIALFVARAAATDPSFAPTPTNAIAIARICARLDGLPLAIELAAARIGVLTPAAMLDRLTYPLTLLTDGASDLPPRHRTMRAAIAWSYDRLSPSGQALLRHLAIVPGSFTLEAAATVSVLDSVAHLIGQSLVQRVESGAEPRFALLETIRAFGLEEAIARGELTAAQAAAAACGETPATATAAAIVRTESPPATTRTVASTGVASSTPTHRRTGRPAPVPTPRQRNPAGLSNREIEVLRLVATGMTNAEVADNLFLSPRTIHAHLHRIYAKIGVATRSAATRFTLEHRLHQTPVTVRA